MPLDNNAPIFRMVPSQADRKELITFLDHRLSALLSVVVRGDMPLYQSHRDVYNSALEGAW